MGSRGLAVPHVLAIGASAGGIRALRILLDLLPKDLSAAILIVQHLSPDFVSRLPSLLERSGFPVSAGIEGVPIETGRVYVAPPGRHMLVDEGGSIRLQQSARVHFARPSVDALFCSAAPVYRDRLVAVVLTGGGSDGTDGARVVRHHGGRVIVQSEASSEHFGMPGAVIAGGHADFVLPLSEIAPCIVDLTATPHG